MDKSQAIAALRPGAEFNIRYSKDGSHVIEWLDTVQALPSDDEINTFLAAHSYRELRATEYPLISDQLDAIMKGGQALADMQAACMAVKAKYPKGA